MGLALLILVTFHTSCWRIAAPTRIAQGSPSAELLQEEERGEQEHRSQFAAWCRSESSRQTAYRKELEEARQQAAAPEGSVVLLDTLSHQAASLAGILEHRRAEVTKLVERRSRAALALKHLEKQVEALSSTKGQLESGSHRLAGGKRGKSFLQVHHRSVGSLKIISALLEKAQSRRKQVAYEVARKPEELQREVDLLELAYQSNTSGLAALKTTRKAAQKRQELILSALESEDAFLADVDSICRLGNKVYGRVEAEIPKLLEGVLALVDRSAEELRTSTAPPTTTLPPPPPPPPSTSAAPVLVSKAPEAEAPVALVSTDPPAPTTTAPAALAADPTDDLASQALAPPPPPPRPRRQPVAPSSPPAVVEPVARARPSRAPVLVPHPPPPAVDEDEVAAEEMAKEVPPSPPPPPARAGRPRRAARAAALQTEAESEPLDPPAPPVRPVRQKARARDEEEDMSTEEQAEDPPPPAHHRRARATTTEDPGLDPDNDPLVEPRKKASPRQRGIAEAKRMEAQFDEGDDSGGGDVPAAGPSGHLRADGDRLAQLQKGSKSSSQDDGADADADEEAAPQPPKKKRARETTTTPLADPFADDDSPAPPPPRKKHVQTTTTPLADPFADDDTPAPPLPRKKHAQATTTTPLADPFADDDAPADPKPARKKRQASPATEEASDDLGDAADDAPPPPRRRKRRPAVEAVQEDSSSGDGGQEDASDDPPPPPRKHRRKTEPAADSDSAPAEDAPAPPADAEAPPTPQSLQGGWKSMMRNSKKKKKKHDFHDQTSGIMDLVQTPTTYTAWHPEHSDTSLASSAKNELLAAEKAFDTSDGGDDSGGAASFLQVLSATNVDNYPPISIPPEALGMQQLPPPPPSMSMEDPGLLVPPAALMPLLAQAPPSEAAPATSAAPASEDASVEAAGAASLLLEQYARSLGSASLMQLARSRPSLASLRTLWKRLDSAGSTSASTEHDAETSMWCRDFERQAEAMTRAADRSRSLARTGLAAVNAEHKALEQEVIVRKHILAMFKEGSKNLNALLGRERRRSASTSNLLRSVQGEVETLISQNKLDKDSNVSVRIAAMQESIGRAEGLSTSADSEMQDIISSSLTRRSDVERSVQAGVAQIQNRIRNLEKRRSDLRRAAAPPAPEQGGAAALKEHYGQMCRWTLDEIQARKLHEESEKDAIRAALAILEVH